MSKPQPLFQRHQKHSKSKPDISMDEDSKMFAGDSSNFFAGRILKCVNLYLNKLRRKLMHTICTEIVNYTKKKNKITIRSRKMDKILLDLHCEQKKLLLNKTNLFHSTKIFHTCEQIFSERNARNDLWMPNRVDDRTNKTMAKPNKFVLTQRNVVGMNDFFFIHPHDTVRSIR